MREANWETYILWETWSTFNFSLTIQIVFIIYCTCGCAKYFTTAPTYLWVLKSAVERICVVHIPVKLILNCQQEHIQVQVISKRRPLNCPVKEKLHFLAVRWKLAQPTSPLNCLRDTSRASSELPREPFVPCGIKEKSPRLPLLFKCGHALLS